MSRALNQAQTGRRQSGRLISVHRTTGSSVGVVEGKSRRAQSPWESQTRKQGNRRAVGDPEADGMEVLTTARTRRGRRRQKEGWRYIYLDRMVRRYRRRRNRRRTKWSGRQEKARGSKMPIACRRLEQGGQGDDTFSRWDGMDGSRENGGTALFSPQHALKELTRPPCRGTIA